MYHKYSDGDSETRFLPARHFYWCLSWSDPSKKTYLFDGVLRQCEPKNARKGAMDSSRVFSIRCTILHNHLPERRKFVVRWSSMGRVTEWAKRCCHSRQFLTLFMRQVRWRKCHYVPVKRKHLDCCRLSQLLVRIRRDKRYHPCRPTSIIHFLAWKAVECLSSRRYCSER